MFAPNFTSLFPLIGLYFLFIFILKLEPSYRAFVLETASLVLLVCMLGHYSDRCIIKWYYIKYFIALIKAWPSTWQQLHAYIGRHYIKV